MTANDKIKQSYLDSTQYATDSIAHYEAIYGKDFVSPGGYAMAKELIQGFDHGRIDKVLDVGCGLGGSAFVMASEFGLNVDGIDLSKNMLAIANEKLQQNGLDGRVDFRWGDCLDLNEVAKYDAVYSRDVFLHIDNKALLFKVLLNCLKPNGQLLFTDYCCGPKPWQPDFSAYVVDRQYRLHTLEDYAELIQQAGFESVEYEDLTSRFIELLESELIKIETLELNAGDKKNLKESWQQKIKRAKTGDHRWGLFSAVKSKY